MELTEARAGAAAFLEVVAPPDESLRLATGDEQVADIGWAWVFAWSTAQWFETGQGRPPAGGGPIVVVKSTGDTWMLTGATSYDEQLAGYAAGHGLEHTVSLDTGQAGPEETGRRAAAVLAEWLTAQSPARPEPVTVADLAGWRCRPVRDWVLFEMPGFSNALFLVRDLVVYEFQPSRMTVDEALVAAGQVG